MRAAFTIEFRNRVKRLVDSLVALRDLPPADRRWAGTQERVEVTLESEAVIVEFFVAQLPWETGSDLVHTFQLSRRVLRALSGVREAVLSRVRGAVPAAARDRRLLTLQSNLRGLPSRSPCPASSRSGLIPDRPSSRRPDFYAIAYGPASARSRLKARA